MDALADDWGASGLADLTGNPTDMPFGTGEAVPARAALELFFGEAEQPTHTRTVAPGQPGDLCVLRASPDEALAELDSGMVAVTVVGGMVVFDRSREPAGRLGSSE